MDDIQFIGVSRLDAEDKDLVVKLCSAGYKRVKRAVHNEVGLVVHIKKHTKGGRRCKYSVHMRAMAPTRIFETSKNPEWDLGLSLKESFDDLEKEIKKAFKAGSLVKQTSQKKPL